MTAARKPTESVVIRISGPIVTAVGMEGAQMYEVVQVGDYGPRGRGSAARWRSRHHSGLRGHHDAEAWSAGRVHGCAFVRVARPRPGRQHL